MSDPVRNIAALLPSELANGQPAEDDEVAAGKRLAARFVRRPEEEAHKSSRGSFLPYAAVVVFIMLAAGGAAFYFMRQEGSGTADATGGGYVAASFNAPFAAGSGVQQPQAASSWTPQNPAQGSGSNSWAEAVETFRALAPETAAPPEKVSEPKLEQLATGYNSGAAK